MRKTRILFCAIVLSWPYQIYIIFAWQTIFIRGSVRALLQKPLTPSIRWKSFLLGPSPKQSLFCAGALLSTKILELSAILIEIIVRVRIWDISTLWFDVLWVKYRIVKGRTKVCQFSLTPFHVFNFRVSHCSMFDLTTVQLELHFNSRKGLSVIISHIVMDGSHFNHFPIRVSWMLQTHCLDLLVFAGYWRGCKWSEASIFQPWELPVVRTHGRILSGHWALFLRTLGRLVLY